jgi:hypothetical protein
MLGEAALTMTRTLSFKINRNPRTLGARRYHFAQAAAVFTDQYIFHHVVR